MLCDFLENKTSNFDGFTLHQIWEMNDAQIESKHTFIQWVFPTNEPSSAVPSSPYLNDEQVQKIRNSSLAKQNLSKSADWFFDFLGRNSHWRKPYDHNHLRITRTLKSLRVLNGDDEADYYKEQLWQILGADIAVIPAKTLEFWEDA